MYVLENFFTECDLYSVDVKDGIGDIFQGR